MSLGDTTIGGPKLEILGKQKVAEEVKTIYFPRIGVLARDDLKDDLIRDGFRIVSDHPEISIYEVSDGFLANEYVVYDKNSVYFVTSLSVNSVWPAIREKRRQDFVSIARSVKLHVSEEHKDQSVFVAHNEGGGTWGHYLAQNLPKMLLAKSIYPSLKLGLPASYGSNKNSSWFQLLDRAGFSEADIIPLDRNITYSFKKIFFCDFLWDFVSGCPHPLAIDFLRGILKNGSLDKETGISAGRKVFIERDARYGRNIENIEQIKKICDEFGIEIHKTAGLSVGAQIDLFRSSQLVIGTLGSDLTNVVFCSPDTHVLSLSPTSHGDNFFYNMSAALNLVWSEILCTKKGVANGGRSFHLDPEVFSLTLRKILNS
ncbi:glycosyltransferase family 61 protein [Acidisoma cellulosilytica]|uniref:Glycosyltransferase family 61 protein n=1 Tax=Acidisoma cellulosilyticum TaxID=2802395 RepID=A0A963YYZ6_9PROT|nr:glycosyltransferase family 61 protein [Acidisoma cellulosilyticum]MCB8878768.1 glycosyltransferase family 61 protein [Acidisoma cellulosilyticum]